MIPEIIKPISVTMGMQNSKLLCCLLPFGVYVQWAVRRVFPQIDPAAVFRHDGDSGLLQKIKVVFFLLPV